MMCQGMRADIICTSGGSGILNIDDGDIGIGIGGGSGGDARAPMRLGSDSDIDWDLWDLGD
ncbi:MAG: hypothetical protein IJ635_06655 [Bacteroidaceae bacterium]|nr:hypothetical protein [Bacteroidaceae bacterium]